MAYHITPYAYRPGNTFLHRVPAGIKLLGLFLISSTALYPGYGQLGAALCIILGAGAAKIRPWELLRGSGPVAVMALFVILLRSVHFSGVSSAELFGFSYSGFIAGVLFGIGIMLAFSAGSLLFSVTTMTELRDSLSTAEAAVRAFPIRLLKKNAGPRATRKLEHPRLSVLSFGISLMLGFLPRFFEIWEDTDSAYQARAGKKGIAKILLLIPLVTERMIAAAMETAAAMESRGAVL